MHDKDLKDITRLFHFLVPCVSNRLPRRNSQRLFLLLVLKLNYKMEPLMLSPKGFAFIFTCMYQQRYTKRLVLVETARSVAKFYRSVVVFISFLADQASVTISRKGNTLGAVAVLISYRRNSPTWTQVLLLIVLPQIVYHVRSPVWTTRRVSLSTSLLFQIKQGNFCVKSCGRTSAITPRASFRARLFITSALW